MSKFLFINKEIWKGKSVIQSYLNYSLLGVTLEGKTIDTCRVRFETKTL